MRSKIALGIVAITLLVAGCSSAAPSGAEGLVTVAFSGSAVESASLAFSRLAFLDSHAQTLQEIDLTSTEAASILGEGLDADNSQGELLWMGEAASEPRLRLTPPLGTEGVLIRARAAHPTDIFAAVGDGDPVLARLSDRWRWLYIPLGAPDDEKPGAAAPTWTEGHVFPAFPNYTRIYQIRVVVPRSVYFSNFSAWRINQSREGMAALTLVGMQGVINRSGPRVFLDWVGDDWDYDDDYRGYWAQQVAGAKEATYLDLDPESAIRFLW